MIILVGGQKGGTGKSTLACNLALGGGFLVDCDPQKTSYVFAGKAKLGRSAVYGPKVGEVLQGLRPHYGLIVTDCGGYDSVELRSALTVCDLFVTPCQTSFADIATLNDIAAIVHQAKAYNKNLRSRVVLNRVRTVTGLDTLIRDSRELIRRAGFVTCKTVVFERVVYQTALAQGVSVGSNLKASTEITNLREELLQCLPKS